MKLTLAVSAVALATAAPQIAGAQDSEDTYRFVMVSHIGSNDPNMQWLTRSLDAFNKKYPNVETEYLSTNQYSIQEHVRLIEQAMATQPDGLAVPPRGRHHESSRAPARSPEQHQGAVSGRLLAQPKRSCPSQWSMETQDMTDSIAAKVAALPKTPTAALKQLWRELYGQEPPGFSRSYLVSRLAYRIQELAYGGLKPSTRTKLDALADTLDPKAVRQRVIDRPVAGVRLVREWRGAEHTVTVLDDGFEWRGAGTGASARLRAASPVRGGTGRRSSGSGTASDERPADP